MSLPMSSSPRRSIGGKAPQAASSSQRGPRRSVGSMYSPRSPRASSPRSALCPDRRAQSPRCTSPKCSSAASTSDVCSYTVSPTGSPSGSATCSNDSGSVRLQESSSSAALSWGSDGPSSGASTTASRQQGKTAKGFQASLELASCGASATFVKRAEEIYQAGDGVLQEVCSSPSLADAMRRQGLELSELEAGSKLSYTRRVCLLAAALQEESEEAAYVRSPTARVRHHQLEQIRRRSLAMCKRTIDHRLTVEQRQAGLKKAQEECRAEAMREEEERLRRVAEQEQAAFAQFCAHTQQREERAQATLFRAKELLHERIAGGEAALMDQDARIERNLDRREEERAARKELLQRRFQKVQATAQQAYEDAELESQRREQELEAKMNRSEDHIHMCQFNWQQAQQRKHEMEDEREHQILRVSRMHEYRRFHKVHELEEDRELFQECERMYHDTQRIVKDVASGCRFLNLGTISLEDV